MKVSIVITYYNRKKQFYKTLNSIAKSEFKDFEVIAVDDGSLPEERIEDFLNEFLFLKIIRIEPKNKWYINTCIPYNIGIRATRGEIIILQNAECLHVHDVITFLSENVNDSNYITISAYGLDEETTNNLSKYIDDNALIEYMKTLPQKITGAGGSVTGWFNHSKYRPAYYHFCAGITKRNLDLLGGFDERYAFGTAYEDDEFVQRIKRLGLRMMIIDDISVIHQWHVGFQYLYPNANENIARNKALFYNVTLKESRYKINWK